jgi:hypothetical protein
MFFWFRPALLHCAKMREEPATGNFLPGAASRTKLTVPRQGVAFARESCRFLRAAMASYMQGTREPA